MSTHKIHGESLSFYFITFTCYKWLPLFDKADVYEYFPFWFSKLEEKGFVLSGYVIMPNHIHFLTYLKNGENLNEALAEGKRFLAYEITKRLKLKNEIDLLRELEKGVAINEKLKGKKHQVFRLSFDAKECIGEEAIYKVLDYMHHNPVSGEWNLVDDFVEYPYSSAKFYELNEKSYIGVVDFRDVPDPQSPL